MRLLYTVWSSLYYHIPIWIWMLTLYFQYFFRIDTAAVITSIIRVYQASYLHPIIWYFWWWIFSRQLAFNLLLSRRTGGLDRNPAATSHWIVLFWNHIFIIWSVDLKLCVLKLLSILLILSFICLCFFFVQMRAIFFRYIFTEMEASIYHQTSL